jgi:HK97 family phage portal protein
LKSRLRALFKGADVQRLPTDSLAGFGPYGFGGPFPWLTPSSRIDYLTEAGDLTQNAIIMACLHWIGRTFPEAPIRVVVDQATGPAKVVPRHPLTRLLAQPNPYYNGLLMQSALLWSYNLDGNAYLTKARYKSGKLAELWYEPHTTIRPWVERNSTDFISGYQLKRNGRWTQEILPREDVIHFRHGLDPSNPRMGLSPLKAALREVFTDNEAANYTASLLRNMGIPGMVLSPGTDKDLVIEDPEALKETLQARFTGDKRGEPLVMMSPIKVDMLSFSPEQLALDKLRTIPEERITALLGLPAIVANLGAGLDFSSYNNVKELKASAYEGNLLPTQRLMAAQYDTDLLPELGDAETERVEFDISHVQALADDQADLVKCLSLGYKTGWLTRKDARLLSPYNLDTDDDDDVYITDLPAIAGNISEDDPAGTLLGGGNDAAKEELPGAKKTLPEPTTTEDRHGRTQLDDAFTTLLDDAFGKTEDLAA